MEYIHDSLEGFVEIIVAFFLVPANVQGFLGIKVLIEDLLHSSREPLKLLLLYKSVLSFVVLTFSRKKFIGKTKMQHYSRTNGKYYKESIL